MYFVTWHMLISLILLSLIKGIVWEDFTAVQENSMNKADAERETIGHAHAHT